MLANAETPSDITEKGQMLNNHYDSVTQDDSEKVDDRGNWSNKLDFLLSCLGYAVGLGNVWRFPYLCFRNGGGAFLIPYALMLAFCGLPMFFMELGLGQYYARGPNIVFKNIAPICHGVGYAMLVVSFLVVLYYNMIIGWTIFYTFASFTNKLPWEFCGNFWNSKDCYQEDQDMQCQSHNMTYWNNTCYSVEQFCNNIQNLSYVNSTHCHNMTIANSTTENFYISVDKAVKHVSPSEEYYLHRVLGISVGFEEFGAPQWQLVICLFLSWVIVGACLIRGVKSSGKVVYFTALFPYVVLSILLIRGATMEGAAQGIYFYIIPKWDKLLRAQVWGDAAVQLFYSLGPGYGGILTLASYNRFNNNCYRDALMIAIGNCATSVFAGFAIFSILGVMAHNLDLPVEEVVKSGQGLAFIAYPEAVTKMPVSQLWSILFFFMLITLGLDTQFTMCETVLSALQDLWPQLLRYKSWIVILTSFGCFIVGLPLCSPGGVYLFTLIDWYAAGWSLMIITFVECLLIAWIYGEKQFCKNIEEMTGYKPNLYWRVCWKYISPALIATILVFTWISYTPAGYGSYVFPQWANIVGWVLAFSSVIMIPIFALYEVVKAYRNGQSVRSLFKPTENWGPSGCSQNFEVVHNGLEKIPSPSEEPEDDDDDTFQLADASTC